MFFSTLYPSGISFDTLQM